MTARALPCYEPDEGTCHSCGCEAACKDTYLGYICAECRRPCAHCEYPMLDDSGLMHDGELMHIACALEAMEDEQPTVNAPIQDASLANNFTTTNLFLGSRRHDIAHR